MIIARTTLFAACAASALLLAQPASAQAADPHAGHTMPDPAPEPASDPHAGHAMDEPDTTDIPAGSAEPPPIPTDHAADAIFGADAMAMGRHHLSHYHGGQTFSMIALDMAEAKIRNGRDTLEWNAEAWFGGDLKRFIVKSEGEVASGGGVESAEVQALYSRAVGPYFDVRAGLRYDFEPDPSRVYVTAGLEGLAPGFIEVEGALFLSDRGELMARLEAHYDQRITQKLILQPRAEMNLAAQDSRDIGVGAGLSDAEIGVRLRYDIAREFAPYLGVEYERAFGKTREFLREDGEEAGGWSFLAGIKVWF